MKQRFIDADKLIKEMTQNCPFVLDTNYESIYGIPIVEAIPVAFIEEQMRKYEELAYQSTPKIQQRYFDKATALKSLIDNWQDKGGNYEPKH